MPLKCLYSFLAAFWMLTAATAGLAAQTRLSGTAELVMGEHTADEGGRTALDASYFAQQYSLLYEFSDQIRKGTAGYYDLAIGYEWNSLDSDIDQESVDIETGKVLYRGELLFAPGGLPFRLHLYSRDLIRSSFVRRSTSTLFEDEGFYGLNQGSYSPLGDLFNGQHIRTGANLTFGIRNGSYLGRYRDALASFPRVFVDYAEDYVKDLKSETPIHYRDRNLAFVSLNKKDNWFHYRVFQHEDKLNPDQDFSVRSYLLGTVDHLQQRQWINLTNWIRISTDAGLTSQRSESGTQAEFDRVDLNLFTRAFRSDWRLSAFNTFSRIRDLGQETLEKRMQMPIFLEGEISRDTIWRARLIGDQYENSHQALDLVREEENVFAGGRLETWRRSRFILAGDLETEYKAGSYGEGEAARVGFEYFSNRQFRPKYHIFSGYSLGWFQGTGGGEFETDFLEHDLRLRVETDLTARTRGWVGQEFIYGSGDLDETVTNHIKPKSSLGVATDTTLAGNSRRSGNVFRSISSMGVESRWRRVSNRLELIYDYLSTDEGDSDLFEINQHLRYSTASIFVSWRNRLLLGENLRITDNFSENLIAAGDNSGIADTRFLSHGQFRYAPSRYMEGNLDYDLDWQDGDDGSESRWRLDQSYRYNFYKINGYIRKWAEVGERIEYERYTPIFGERRTAVAFSLMANYFPTSIAFIGGRVRYKIEDPEDTETWTYFASAGLNFQKLQIAFDYSYGTRTEGENLAEREEHRWEAKVRKIF